MKFKLLRSRIRIEILSFGSSPRSRFELFQRLNTGGSLLTRQEIRTCSVVMIKPDFQEWLEELAKYPAFVKSTKLTAVAKEKQRLVELVLKYLVCNLIPYRPLWDVHDYLDEGIAEIALDQKFNRTKEEKIFKEIFDLINNELGEKAFRRSGVGGAGGSFSDAAFEALSVGIRTNFQANVTNTADMKKKVKSMWAEPEFKKNTGAGVRGTTRISRIIPFAKKHFG